MNAVNWQRNAELVFLAYVGVILPSGYLISYLDRKLGADFQARVGPNRAGPAGFLQPLADLLKLLQKRGEPSSTRLETLLFCLYTMILYSTVAVLPLGSLWLMLDTDVSALIPIWAVCMITLGTVVTGLSQRGVPGSWGGIRMASQSLSAAFPALVTLLCAGAHAGSFRWSAIVEAQGSFPQQWTLLSDPFEWLAFLIFAASGLILLGVSPFDAGLSMTDLHGGVSHKSQGLSLCLLQAGRFYGLFLWMAISSALFLGGWSLPFHAEADGVRRVLELLAVLSKTFVLLLAVVWLSRVSPKTRVDQITDFSWKVLSPLALFALIGSSLFSAWRSM